MPKIIVSYDDTDNDRDALALGSLFRDVGADISLAYVRHAQQPDEGREALEEKDAEELLKRGAEALGNDSVPRHLVVHASTGSGLWELAESEGADMIVFGSDYRTAGGHVIPGTSAQRLLTGGPVAVAVAPAGYRNEEQEVKAIRLLKEQDGDTAAGDTAKSLADALGAKVGAATGEADLLVIGSSPASPKGHVNLSSRAGYAIETAHSPVIAVPRGTTLKFKKGSLAKRAASAIGR